MKRLLDGLLLVLLLGTPIFLFFTLPDRSNSGSPASLSPELPLPDSSRSQGFDPGTGREDSASDQSEVREIPNSPSELEINSAADRVWEGFLFRGGESLAKGPVPLFLDGVPAPLWADEDGRFQFAVTGRELALGVPDLGGEFDAVAPRILLAKREGGALLSVHQYVGVEQGQVLPDDSRLITPQSALLAQFEGGTPPQLLVRGMAILPDRATVAVRLIAAGHVLESTLLRVRGQNFSGELPLSSRDYHAGRYQLQFAWGPGLATRSTLRALGDSEWALMDGELQVDQGVFFGTPEEARRQKRIIREFYRRALENLEGGRDFVQVLGARARGKRNKLVNDPERAARLRKHSLAPLESEIFNGRRMDKDSWRRLIDEELPEVAQPYLEVEEMPWWQSHPQAAHNLAMMAQQLLKYSKLESTLVYRHRGWKPSVSNHVQNFDFGPEVEKQQTLLRLRNYSDAVRDFTGL